jgi:hypothetical protein
MLIQPVPPTIPLQMPPPHKKPLFKKLSRSSEDEYEETCPSIREELLKEHKDAFIRLDFGISYDALKEIFENL